MYIDLLWARDASQRDRKKQNSNIQYNKDLFIVTIFGIFTHNIEIIYFVYLRRGTHVPAV